MVLKLPEMDWIHAKSIFLIYQFNNNIIQDTPLKVFRDKLLFASPFSYSKGPKVLSSKVKSYIITKTSNSFICLLRTFKPFKILIDKLSIFNTIPLYKPVRNISHDFFNVSQYEGYIAAGW